MPGSFLHTGLKDFGKMAGDGPNWIHPWEVARHKEHKADLKNGVVAHYLEYQRREDHKFKMDVTQKFQKPMQRQITAAVNIHRSCEEEFMRRGEEEELLAEPGKVFHCLFSSLEL